MGSQSRWGLTLPLTGLPLAEQRDLVASLPDLGYTDAWSAELNGIDGFTPLTLASQWAPQLRLGTAIVGIYTRAPVTLAVQAGTLADLAPGKFVMGIGTSSQVAVEQWNGIPFEKPYQRSRDMLRFLREALAGRQGHPRVRDVLRRRLPARPGARGPARAGTGRAAARHGQARRRRGGHRDHQLARSRGRAAGARGGRAGLRAGRPDLRLPDRPTPTRRGSSAGAMIAAYLTVPVYAAFHQWLGRGEIIEPMLAAWNSGDRKGALAAIPDELVDELVIHGPLEHCRERVAEYHATGLDTPVIAITPIPGIDLAEAISKLARA